MMKTFTPLLSFIILIFNISLGKSQNEQPVWEFLPGQVETYSTISGHTSDAVVGPDHNLHILGAGRGQYDEGNGYMRISAEGEILLEDLEAGGFRGNWDKYNPAIGVSPDGTEHAVIRDTTGSTDNGNYQLIYRADYDNGVWNTAYEFGEPETYNHVAGIAVAGDNNVFMAHAKGNDIRIYKDEGGSATMLGDLPGWFAFPNDFQFRGQNEKIYIISSDGETIYFSYADATSDNVIADLLLNLTEHQAGSNEKGMPDLYIDLYDDVYITYGAGQEVYYNKYETDVDGNLIKMHSDDMSVMSFAAQSYAEVNPFPYPMIATSYFGNSVMIVAAYTSLSAGDSKDGRPESKYYWTYSTDKGINWNEKELLSGRRYGDPESNIKERQSAWVADGRRKGVLNYVMGNFMLIHWDIGYYWRGSFGLVDFSNYTAVPRLGPDLSLCANDNSIELSANMTLDGDYSYEWYKDDEPLSSDLSNQSTITINEEGRYNVLVDNVLYSSDVTITATTPKLNLPCCTEFAVEIYFDAGVERPEMTYNWTFEGPVTRLLTPDNKKDFGMLIANEGVKVFLEVEEPGCESVVDSTIVYRNLDDHEECDCESDTNVTSTPGAAYHSFKVYPNPTKNHFVLSKGTKDILGNTLINVNVFDITGKKVQEYKMINNKNTFEFGHDLDPGVYIINIKTNTQSFTYKAVKK